MMNLSEITVSAAQFYLLTGLEIPLSAIEIDEEAKVKKYTLSELSSKVNSINSCDDRFDKKNPVALIIEGLEKDGLRGKLKEQALLSKPNIKKNGFGRSIFIP